jgi:hypothetical protein
MGIGIRGMSKAKLLRCPGDESCDPECIEEHLTVGTPGRGKDAVKMGCYVPGRGGRTSDLDFGYGGYSAWMRRLSLLALGVEPEEVWQHPRRFRGKPFVELINFPDTGGGGAIGPITSAKLYGDFVAFASKARRYYATPPALPADPFGGDQQLQIDKPHRDRTGLTAVVEMAASLGGTVPGLDEGENLDWMWESYQQFRRAFRLAKNAGIVVFY